MNKKTCGVVRLRYHHPTKKFEIEKIKGVFCMDIENAIYNFIVEFGIATEQEIDLVTAIAGYNAETLNDIIYARSGYHDMEQYCECEGIDLN